MITNIRSFRTSGRRAAIIVLASTFACGSSWAQQPTPVPKPRPPATSTPIQITPPVAASPAVNAINRSATPAKVATVDAATAIQKANAFLNATSVTTANFVQLGADGRRAEGKLYLQKPGRVRFDYQPPATLQIISDGSSVAIRDKKLQTQDLYFVAQTPLKFLLKAKIDLASDLKIIEVKSNEQSVSILVEDKATFGGTSRIRLVFDPVHFELKQWTVTDPQGFDTLVSLFDIDTKTPPDPSLFVINYERVKD